MCGIIRVRNDMTIFSIVENQSLQQAIQRAATPQYNLVLHNNPVAAMDEMRERNPDVILFNYDDYPDYWEILRKMQHQCDGYYQNGKTIFDYEKRFCPRPFLCHRARAASCWCGHLGWCPRRSLPPRQNRQNFTKIIHYLYWLCYIVDEQNSSPRAQMPMLPVLTFIYTQMLRTVVVFRYFGGEFRLFARRITYFMHITHPTARGLIFQIRIQMFIPICHSISPWLRT